MNPATTQPVLEENLGKAVAVTYNGGTEHVLVVAVDADGFVCKPVDPAEREDIEFWLAFEDMDELTMLPQAVKSN
ncbi:MAG TPA: hypothetical protein VFB14_16900 [Bryobacteraceae bacterium]|jgi:hypothetical protein|nr:hypothetical protein [Bryobacteraceae bacterium]